MRYRRRLLIAASSLALLSACADASDSNGDRDAQEPLAGAGADAGRPDASLRARPSVQTPCLEVHGWILAPATPGTSLDPKGPPVARVLATVDRVEAQTLDGRVVECVLTGSSYSCLDERGLRSMTAYRGDTSWTRSAGGLCVPSEDFHNMEVDHPDCFDPDAVVLEGDLLGFDRAKAPTIEVTLRSKQEYRDPFYLDGSLSRPCELTGSHFRCTTLGHVKTMEHELWVKFDGKLTKQSFSLEVDQCAVTPLSADVELDCPAVPDALRVDLRSLGLPLPSVEVTVSYEGQPAYPCVQNVGALFEALCPAALSSPDGAGRYEVVARTAERTLRASYERVFNGCTTSNGPVMLSESP